MARDSGRLCLFAILAVLVLTPFVRTDALGRSVSPNSPDYGFPVPLYGPENYTFTFTRTGLPPGTSWEVNLAGENQTSSNNTIVFSNLDAGNYSWSAREVNYTAQSRFLPTIENGTVEIPQLNSTTVHYSEQFFVSLNSLPSQAGAVLPGSGWFTAGSRVQISFKPAQDFVFTNWTGSGSGSYSGNDLQPTLTINGPISETANTLPVYGVVFDAKGLPSGTLWIVTFDGLTQNSTESSISFVARGNGTFGWTATSPIGTSTQGVQYVPASAFGSVSLPKDASDSGVANVVISYTAQYYVSISTSNVGGSVAPKSGWYNAGYELPVFATASKGFNFTGWKVLNSSSSLYTTIGNQSTELVVSVNGPGSIVALFSENPTHGVAQSSPPGIWYQLFNNPALANPYVQVGGVSSIIVIILASVYLGIKRSFTKE